MGSTVEVEVVRYVDRDHVLEALAERGLAASAVEEAGRLAVEIECRDDDPRRLCNELLAELEEWIAEQGLALVPMYANGSIFLRPPGE